MNPQEPRVKAVEEPRGWRRWRVAAILTGAVGLGALILWRLLLPDHARSMAPTLTETDKSEIAHLCRRYTVRFAIGSLWRGDFTWFWRSARVLFRQKIDRFFDDGDGTYRAYVVVYDKEAPDGFNPWIRHQLAKTNGHWTILRSY